MTNLNQLAIVEGDRLADNGASAPAAAVRAYFRDLEDRLVEWIGRADLVVGCVAWLTNGRIIDALSRVPRGVSVVVQKEDFLRPDLGQTRRSAKGLVRELYARLSPIPERHTLGGLVGRLSVCSDPVIDPVRCMGLRNGGPAAAFPRMHNKFLVFCEFAAEDHPEHGHLVDVRPWAVWTGSFNLTANATVSLENAVVVSDPAVAGAYFDEWQQVLALSEPLDWKAEYVAPQWRDGS